jgi:tetratricopeptide (TPR) repeat protein
VTLCDAKRVLIWLPISTASWGWALAWLGRVSEGVSLAERGLRLHEEVGSKTTLPLFYFFWAESLLLAGRIAQAREVAETALHLGREFSEKGHEALALHVLGAITAATDPPEAHSSQNYFLASTTLASVLGMRPLVAHCHLGLGQLYRRTGKREQAQEYLSTATTMYREMDMRFWLEKARAELQALS